MTFLGLRLPVFLLFFLGFPLLWILWIGLYAISPGPAVTDAEIEVVIPVHAGVAEIEKILIDKRVIRDDSRFSMLARSS